MTVLKISGMIPVSDMDRAVSDWSALTGTGPTFRDGDAWCQFDVAGSRIALAGLDRHGDAAGLMVKVDDLTTVGEAVRARGWSLSDVIDGAHERRLVATDPDGTLVIFYAALA